MNIEKEKESTSLPSKQSSQVVISPPSSSPPPKTDTDMTYDDLVSRYILKHNRNPPPGFESWFKSAKLNKCFLDRYDGIYRDLAPFVGLSGKEFTHRLKLATKARSTTTVVIKNGEASVYHPLIANVSV